MTVGVQASNGTIDQQLTSLSVGLRNIMQNISNLSTWVNGQDEGLAFLESTGYDSGDAATALSMIAYMNTISGVYYGTVQQGGSNGTAATNFNFNNELSVLWGGQ
jgi:hypothetical protein